MYRIETRAKYDKSWSIVGDMRDHCEGAVISQTEKYAKTYRRNWFRVTDMDTKQKVFEITR